MTDFLPLLIVIASVALVIQATRRNMAGALSMVAVISLVASVVILSIRNRSLNTLAATEKQLSLKSMDEKSMELEACAQDLESKKSSISDMEILRDRSLREKSEMEKEVDNMKAKLALDEKMTKSIEDLHKDVATLTEKSDRLQKDLEAAKQQISTMNAEKASLQKSLEEALQKLAQAEAAKAAAPAAPAAPKNPPAAPVKVDAAAPAQAQPQAAQPQVAQPQAAQPQVAQPQAAQPKAA